MRPVLLLSLCSGFLIADEPVHQRDFTFEYKATVKDIPAGTEKLELWIPVPHDDRYQRILYAHVDTPIPHRILTGDQGNQMLHLEILQPKETSVPVTLTLHAVRLERIQPIVLVKDTPAPEGDLSRWLKPDRLVPIDGQIRTWAREVVEAAHAQTDLEMARAIYNHVVATVKYDKTGKGWGRGDIYYACDAQARQLHGFPRHLHRLRARHGHSGAIRNRIPAAGRPGRRENRRISLLGGILRERHRMDAGGCVRSRQESRQARILLRRARRESPGILQRPGCGAHAQTARRSLNYFVYPYAEVDGKSYANIETGYSYRDLAPVASTGSLTVAVRKNLVVAQGLDRIDASCAPGGDK